MVNTVNVTGTHNGETVTDEHPAAVHCAAPPEGGIYILKTMDKEHACPGQTLLYRYEVTNLGDAPLHDVQVTDDSCSPIVGPDGDVDRDQQLDADETWVYICGSVVGGREPNPLENRVIVSGYEPQAGAAFVDRDPGIVEIVTCPQPEFVPEVGTLLLLTTGFAGMAGYAGLRMRRRS